MQENLPNWLIITQNVEKRRSAVLANSKRYNTKRGKRERPDGEGDGDV